MRSHMFRLAALAAAAASLCGCGGDWVQTKGMVREVRRTCSFHYERQHSYGESFKDDCSTGPGWENARAHYKGRRLDLKGEAVVTIDYLAPGEGVQRTGTMTFTGRDDAFYALSPGQEVTLSVDRADPSRISNVRGFDA